jgi:hypothetical protein
MGTTMANPACEWVRARLPLWVAAGDDPAEVGGEGSDLSVEDRRSLDRHLAACPACRQHRTALEQALGALIGAAAVAPIPPDTPSLWPALEQRIQAYDARTDACRPSESAGVVDGGLRAWADLDSERSLQSAWVRDSLREGIERAGRGLSRGLWRVVGSSAAAAILALVLGILAAQRRQADAEATILANAAPRGGWVIPPGSTQPKLSAPAGPGTERELPAPEVAQVEPVPVPEPSASARDAAASGSKPAPPTRLRYDLEPGIPMPPDARDAKPVY